MFVSVFYLLKRKWGTETWTFSIKGSAEGQEMCGAGWRGWSCECSPEHQCNVAVMSQGHLSVSCGRAGWQTGGEKDTRGHWELIFMLHRFCSRYVVACVCCVFVCMHVFLHWGAMTGTRVQLSLRAVRCDWPGLTGQCGSCPTEQCVGSPVCLHVVCSAVDTRVLPPKRHNHWSISLCLSA